MVAIMWIEMILVFKQFWLCFRWGTKDEENEKKEREDD